ncbi:MAG: sulfotransferase domain-containing protein, partial [Sphingomonadales bacterium]
MTGQARSIPELLEKLVNLKSEEGLAHAKAFVPRPDDVLIATFAKAGTTWLQQIVHVLRTGGDMDFGEITEVVPWIETAFDMGIDLEAEQRGGIRAFKSHWGRG